MKWLILSVFLSADVFACSFDTDCGVGEKCVKKGFSLSGACIGRDYGGYRRPREDGYKPKYGSTGKRCSFTAECDPGQQCLKEGSSLYGKCL